jgi:hypothetical protein
MSIPEMLPVLKLVSLLPLQTRETAVIVQLVLLSQSESPYRDNLTVHFDGPDHIGQTVHLQKGHWGGFGLFVVRVERFGRRLHFSGFDLE